MVLIYASASVTTAKYPKLFGGENVETLLILALISKTPEFVLRGSSSKQFSFYPLTNISSSLHSHYDSEYLQLMFSFREESLHQNKSINQSINQSNKPAE